MTIIATVALEGRALTPGIAVADIDIAGGIAAANAHLMGARLIRDRRPDTYDAGSGRIPNAVDG
jgi:hypothetical protein